jgi:hypothetical protein
LAIAITVISASANCNLGCSFNILRVLHHWNYRLIQQLRADFDTPNLSHGPYFRLKHDNPQ